MPLSLDWATKFGRPDLAGVPVDPWGGTSNVLQSRVSIGAGQFGTAEGRLTAGLLGVMVVGLVLFYAWTRGHQA
jgi:hypothetical protein